MAEIKIIDERGESAGLHLRKTAETHAHELSEAIGMDLDIDAVIPEKAKNADRIKYNLILAGGVLNPDEILSDPDIKRKAAILNRMFDADDNFFELKKHGKNIVLQITEIESSLVAYIKEEFGERERDALTSLMDLVVRTADIEPSLPRGTIARILGARGSDGASVDISPEQRRRLLYSITDGKGNKGGPSKN